MKNKILKIAFCFVLFSALLVTASFATTVKEEVEDYHTTGAYIMGATRFDTDRTITASVAAKAGVNEAKLNLALGRSIDNLDMKFYYYNKNAKAWYEVGEEVKQLTTAADIQKVENNLNIFFVNNVEKTVEVSYEGNANVDKTSLSNNVKYDSDKKVFTVPATTFTFTYTETKVVEGEEVKVNKEVVTNVDKNLTAKSEAEIEKPVTVTIPENAVAKVGNEYFEAKDLASAITKSNAENPVTLLADVTLDKVIELNLEGKSAVLDLDGYTIDSSNVEPTLVKTTETATKSYAFILTSGELSIKNGTIKTKTVDKYRNILNEGATLNVDGVSLIGNYNIDTNSRYSTKAASTTVKYSELTSDFACIVGWTGANVNIDNSTLISDFYCVSGNGTQSNAVFNITNSTLESYTGAGVYMPSTKALNITNSTITGKSGIEVAAGIIEIEKSNIEATGEYKKTFDKETTGIWTEGSAIFIRVQKGYNDGGEIRIYIDSDTKLTSKNGDGVRVYECKSSTAEYGANIVYVKYSSKNTTATNGNPIKIETQETTAITDLSVTDEGIGQRVVNTAGQLADAIADSTEHTPILLNKDIVLSSAIEVNTTVTVNLNGHTIDSTNVAKDPDNFNMSYAFKVTNEGNLSIKNGTMKTTKEPNNSGDLVMNILNLEGTLNADNVKFVGYYNIYTNYKKSTAVGTTNVSNCTLDSYFAALVGCDYGVVNVSNSNASGHWYAIAGNGSCKDTVFNVTDCTLTSEAGAAIFMPSTKSLNVSGSTLTGLSGIEGAAGTITITDTDIKAIGTYKATFDNDKKTGCWVEGSAIFIRVQGGYADNTALTLKIDDKSTLTSDNGNGIRVYESSSSAEDLGVDSVDIKYYSNTITATNEQKTLIESKTEKPVTLEDLYAAK